MANRTVSVALVADVGQYQSAMVKAAATTKTVGETAAVAGTKAQRGFDMASRGALVLGGIAAGGLVLGLKSAVDAASAAEQSIGGVQAVFKDYAKTVIADSQEADRALGLSANSYRELATVIGSQMKNAGVPMEQLAQRTEGVIQIGADLAAQFGGSTQEAVEALSSAFRGELDPIERYGISLSAARVGAKAVQMGLADSATELDQNAKLMATLALVTEQSADAQGAFARESDTAAGRAARAAAQWNNLKVTIGDELLPAWSGLMDLLGTTVIPLLGDLVAVGGGVLNFLGDLPGPMKAAAVAAVAWAVAGERIKAVGFGGGLRDATRAFGEALGYAKANGDGFGTVLRSVGDYAGGQVASGFKRLAAAIGPELGIAAAVYVATDLASTLSKMANAGDEARREVDDLDDSLAAMNGASLVEATARAVDNLRQKLADARAEADVGGGDFLGAIGDPTRLGELTASFEDASASADVYREKIADLQRQQAETSATTDQLAGYFDITSDKVLSLADAYGIDLTNGADAALGALAGAITAEQQAASGASAATTNTDLFAQSLEDAADAADDAKRQTDLFKMSLDILTGAHISLAEAEASMYAALADSTDAMENLTGAVVDNAGQLDLQSEAGRQAQGVLFNIRDAGDQYIATLIEQGASTEDVIQADHDLRESFINSAQQMGISRQAAENLADQILGIPSERETTIKADTSGASTNIRNLQAQIDGLRGKTVTVKVITDRAALATYAAQNGMQTVGGYASGGYTGPGGKYEYAGPAHKGEVVWSQEDVAAHGGPRRVDRMRRARGYADGGIVGSDIRVQGDSSDLRAGIQAVTSAMARSLVKIPTYSVGAGAEQWRGTVLRALAMLGLSSGLADGVLGIISRESGGNPNAINLWDSNAMAGHPSRGLMQTIPTTFAAWRSPSLPNNIVDPLANIYAGINYAWHRYGASMLSAGGRHGAGGGYIGYASGGATPAGDPFWVGENGPELMWSSRRKYVSSAAQSREVSGASAGSPRVNVAAPSLEGLRLTGTMDLGGGLEARMDARIVSALTAADQRTAYQG